MEPVFNAIQTVNPLLALGAGIGLGALATLALVYWKPRSCAKSDPLSNLFEGDTLQTQIERVADQAVRSERTEREASAIRARISAHRAAQASTASLGPVPPHRAERFDHAAVLDHIAKVMRAGTQLDKEPHRQSSARDEGEWEEVLLLPAPASEPSQRAA